MVTMKERSSPFRLKRSYPHCDSRRSVVICECDQTNGIACVLHPTGEDPSGLSQTSYESHRTSAERSTQRYLKSIRYGNGTPTRDINWEIISPLPRDLPWCFEVIFDYGEHDEEKPTTDAKCNWHVREDPFSVYKSCFEIRTYRRCNRVLMFHHFPEELKRQDCLVYSTCFQYHTDPDSGSAFLDSCTQNGYSPIGEDEYQTSSLPAFRFEYQKTPPPCKLETRELAAWIPEFKNSATQWIDLNGEGAPGVLAELPGAWYYRRNLTSDLGTQLGDPQLVDTIPSMLNDHMWEFEDIAGDGLPSVVIEAPDMKMHGFYGRESKGGWNPFTPFESNPILFSAGRHNVRRVDLTGDGRADLLQMVNDMNEEFAWCKSLGTGGYGPARSTAGAPKLFLGDPNSAILLCDMSGDGLADIVHFGNGNICYWPNMGYGTFGAQVVMGNAPAMASPSEFSSLRIRTADLTGSGTTDLIYLLPDGGAMVYYNQVGNRWSEGCLLPFIPALDHTSSVDVLDITGRGTPCLCWASNLHGNASNGGLGTIRYIDLTGGQRPGLLSRSLNGIGGETTLEYRSSSMFYREDERNGRPWTTKMPFPIQCASRIEVVDHIAQTSHIKRYDYHNGYYDPIDRQFRGFQMVETWDAEEYEAKTASSFQRPPVLSRSWYYLGHEEVDSDEALPWRFLVCHPQHADISSAKIPSNITPQERHEAYRALAGRPRRQELFSSDASDGRTALPYMITQQRYEVVLEQKIVDKQRHAVYRVNDLEELESQLLDYDDQRRQTETVIEYTETTCTNAVKAENYFHTPLVAGVRRYRVFPVSPPGGLTRYSWDELAADDFKILKQATEVPAHQGLPDVFAQENPKSCKTLLTAEQVLYTDDMRNPLDFAVLMPFSNVYQTYKLVFTSEFLAKAYSDIPTNLEAAQLQAGGYVERPASSGQWWLPSSRALLEDPLSDDWLAAARSHFYIPNGHIDPFGNVSREYYDRHCLLTTSSSDASLNTTVYQQDYARLQPTLITDANMNQIQMALDSLGLPIGIATRGKSDDFVGDNVDDVPLKLDDKDLKNFLLNPTEKAAQLLGKATSRTIYDFHRYEKTTGSSHQPDHLTPPFMAQLVRHNHCALNEHGLNQTQISIHITYINGTGQSIQEATFTCKENPSGSPTWNITGWVRHDNKGDTPSFSSANGNLTLPATTFVRDPLGRVVGVLNADHTWTKTRFTPWMESSFDAGDTILIDPTSDVDVGSYFRQLKLAPGFTSWYHQRTDNASHQYNKYDEKAAQQSKIYHDTPVTTHLDVFGHPIIQGTSNGMVKRETKTKFDIRGNLERTLDTLERTVEISLSDLLGRPVRTCNMDKGKRWLLLDCQNTPLLSWSDRGIRQRVEYDKLRRPTNTWVQYGAAEKEVLTVQRIYGEANANAVSLNLKGQLWQCYDQSGLHTNHRFDFKGNCIESSIRYADEYKKLIDWSEAQEVTLEEDEYKSTITFNALDQPLDTVADGVGRVQREYDAAGRLRALRSYDRNSHSVTSSAEGIMYEPDGQLKCVTFGKGSRTTHTYDRKSRRLIATCSVRLKDKKVLQNLVHTHDCMGNIVRTQDSTQQVVFFQNKVVSPERQFEYDLLGQIVRATGREQVNAAHGGGRALKPYDFNSGTRNSGLGDGRRMIRYEESYTYDNAGNLLLLQHTPANPYSGWTREYKYNEESRVCDAQLSNRLSSTSSAGRQQDYEYDDDAGRHGCMTEMPGYSSLRWDYTDKLQSLSMQRVSVLAAPETTWYVYDANGTRVRKITERSADPAGKTTPTKSKETKYLPLFELFVAYQGDGCSRRREITTLNVGDAALGTAPIATLEKGHSSDLLVQYQLSPHLGLDNNAAPIFYEEYSPFGTSTYQYRHKGVSRNYRFAGYYRDKESGLYHCGERYYAPWLGRWTSPDPLGTVDGLNLYIYAGNDPVNFDDHRGTAKQGRNRQGQPRQNHEPSTSQGQPHRPVQQHRHSNDNSDRAGPSGSHTIYFRPCIGHNQQGGRAVARAGNPGHLQEAVPCRTFQLELCDIRWSQKNVAQEVHVVPNDKKGILREAAKVKRQFKQAKAAGLSEEGAAQRALEYFHRRYDHMHVTPVPVELSAAEKEGMSEVDRARTWWALPYFTLDNRRLTVLKNAGLPPNTLIEVHRASMEESIGSWGGIRFRNLLENIEPLGTSPYLNRIELEIIEAHDRGVAFPANLTGKFTTETWGRTITIRRKKRESQS
ncbi:uncharacterized protein BO87DRAFT_418303 [Aspergillus neoniger CBS 115656]|uniref:Insecticide toxin TcdB middle/N-terminal domain-containing protein n=1 Tax=Aspergillus neoniger (strain CBS 115656) TaxID=1448310 RepID=A0A318YA91_ASPNB|nr:hypothetical protein BO87DRAFT_418303 [Aspergillus neoniger CBS 115656]PYH31236.1 hypothetical protein BO87DRAFT_418303 [Aspergillus neoniger CBS 115656]